MFKLIKNELIKIYKRKNIYILFLIAMLVILGYNSYQKIINVTTEISILYERSYRQDKLYLENYENLTNKEKYTDIIERIKLEEYAIDNKIEYNILVNSESKNIKLPADARNLLMKVFNNFDIIIIFIIVYISSTIISEEYINGTIKNLLIKPHTRIKILISKILTSISTVMFVAIFIIIFQYILGGILFGFDSYGLEAIRYNHITQNIDTMELVNYILLIFLCKIPMYILLNLIGLLFGTITSNVAINILLSLELYIASTIEILINELSRYLFIYNWDISKCLFGSVYKMALNLNIVQSILILTTTTSIIFILLIIIFKNKDIKNE